MIIDVTKDDAMKYFRNREKSFHVNERVFESIENSNELKLFEIENKDFFLSLIWQEVDSSRLLTPEEMPRTLLDIVKRFNTSDYTFSSLSENPKKYENETYDPEWFIDCNKIDKEFDFNNFGWLVLVEPTESEQKQSPCGKFYIYDGVHRSLVLANKLFLNVIKYQKIKALLITPRPND